MVNLETAIPFETKVIKIEHSTSRVPVGTVLTFRSAGPLSISFSTVELGSYYCLPDCYEELI